MDTAIRWMISASGLVTGGIALLAACAVIYARIRYVERQMAATSVVAVIDTTTEQWLHPEQPVAAVAPEPEPAPEPLAPTLPVVPVVPDHRPTTLDEWLEWDYLSETAAEMYEDSRVLDGIEAVATAGMLCWCQWAIAKLGTTEGALREDTTEHKIIELRKEIEGIRSEMVSA